MKSGKTGLARLIDATSFSFKGIRACWLNEAAFRQEVLLVAILLPLSFWVAASVEQWLLLILPLLLLLIVELLNSAVENIVDRIGPDPHELSGPRSAGRTSSPWRQASFPARPACCAIRDADGGTRPNPSGSAPAAATSRMLRGLAPATPGDG